MGKSEDFWLLDYAQKLIANNQSQVYIQELTDLKSHHHYRERVRQFEQVAPNHISILPENSLQKNRLQSADLLIISISTWAALIHNKEKVLVDAPSTLIIKS
jgi:hypothetical protein